MPKILKINKFVCIALFIFILISIMPIVAYADDVTNTNSGSEADFFVPAEKEPVEEEVTEEALNEDESALAETETNVDDPPVPADASSDDTLPQTGILFLPIPILAILGLSMVIISFVSSYRREKKKLKPRMFLPFVGVLSILSSIGVMSYNHWDDYRAEQIAALTTQMLYDQLQTESIIEEYEETYIEDDIQLIEIEGEFYIGILNIPSLELELPINNEWSEKKLTESACRYSGDFSNSMVICAHNYKTHFGRISNLQIGDKLSITDAKGEEHWYVVETSIILKGTDTDVMVNNPYDLTLFTCTLDGLSRLTVRCSKSIE